MNFAGQISAEFASDRSEMIETLIRCDTRFLGRSFH